jgi:hypothetical protein
VSRELRQVEAMVGPRGTVVVLANLDPGVPMWLTKRASDEMVSAAHRLGFGDDSDGVGRGWFAVADAIVAGCLIDVLSEAIEAVEALPIEPGRPDTSETETPP